MEDGSVAVRDQAIQAPAARPRGPYDVAILGGAGWPDAVADLSLTARDADPAGDKRFARARGGFKVGESRSRSAPTTPRKVRDEGRLEERPGRRGWVLLAP